MKTAYVTTLCNGDGYVPGVEALGKSLERTGSTVSKVALVTPDVPDHARERLLLSGFTQREIAPIENPNPDSQQFFARFANTFTKLRAFGLAEFDKIVLMDADTIVLQNIDDLFERPSIAAAPDFLLPDRFNSGVMVIEPSEALFARMMEQLFSMQSYDGGDQGFLNTFFAGWYDLPSRHRLPAGYNMHQFIYQFLRGHPSLLAQLEREVKVIHYTVQKPWLAAATLAGGSEAWWEMYFNAHPEQASAWKRRMHAMEDSSFDHMLRALLG
jgi:lipopolysaccharide biosynthesis glycosyltransferase